MATKTNFQRTCSEYVCQSQEQALASTLYILREYGPTGFLLKEDEEDKTFKIFLGQEHNCSCPAFQKTKELCKHICWLLLKKFKVSKNDPLSWKKGLNEREINGMLYNQTHNIQANNSESVTTSSEKSHSDETMGMTSGSVDQRPIDEDSVCPICLDNLLQSHQPVTYCRYGCGNSIHIKCMKIQAVHQKSTNDKETITCPMCRASFISLETLRKEERNSMNGVSRPVKNYHHGVTCEVCRMTPITGNCYKCKSCECYYLCQACFNMPIHQEHSFKFRQRKIQKWQSAYRNYGYTLPNAMVNNLMGRELKTEDYDALLQLDNETITEFTSLPEKVIDSLPLENIAKHSILLAQGSQCHICLQPFQIYQPVRSLPCQHKFHRECIDNWLLHSHAVCPIDGQEVWNPFTEVKKKVKKKLKKKEECSSKEALSLDITGCSLETPQVTKTGLSQHGRKKSLQKEKVLENNAIKKQNFLLNGKSISLDQSLHVCPNAEPLATQMKIEAGDHLPPNCKPLTSTQCSMETNSPVDKIKNQRELSLDEVTMPCQQVTKRVTSAPPLRYVPRILPPIQTKDKMQKLRLKKIMKSPSEDILQIQMERRSLLAKLGKVSPKSSKSCQLHPSKFKPVNLDKLKQARLQQNLFLEGSEINLKQ